MTREEALALWRIAPEIVRLIAKSQEIASRLTKGHPSFCCPRCLAESFNPHDVEHQYCGRCHMFIRDATPLSQSTTHIDPPQYPQRPKPHEDAQWLKDGGWGGKR